MGVVNSSNEKFVPLFPNGDDVPNEDDDSMMETHYLFSSPKNAQRLLRAMQEIDNLIEVVNKEKNEKK